MTEIYNFSAGPAMLPKEVMLTAQRELLNWHDCGVSVLEMSHRSQEFMAIQQQAEDNLRRLLHIPQNYKVLFITGGATAQFSMVPLNLLPITGKADYIYSGIWSKKAIAEAKRYGEIHIAAAIAEEGLVKLPSFDEWQLSDDAGYIHYTANETISGAEYHGAPEDLRAPLVSDMSSTLLSRPVDVTKYGIIYACAQKNIAPSGVTVVIIREDLLGKAFDFTPILYDYTTYSEHESMYNTSPTFNIYMTALVTDWIWQQGGLEAMAERNRRKSELLYELIDNSKFYQNNVHQDSRSWMNVTFTLAKPELEKMFISEAKEIGLLGIKGHRSVGGMRASLYNAVPEEGVMALADFMKKFERKNG